MQFVQPLPFHEAIDKLGAKSPIGSKLSSSEWSDLPVALRERAYFSSKVESVRVLQRGQDVLGDFLSANRIMLPSGDVALAAGSRADFVSQMQDFMAREGIERTGGGLEDVSSETRLGLVFDTQTQQAQDYGYWRQGQDPDILDEFPAQRFIRVIDVDEPRTSHARYENQVYLKSDPIWHLQINEDFGVPWGPWAWGCGHDVEDVDRATAEAMGLLQPGQKIQPDEKHFNENLKASTRGLDPDLLEKLKNEFGDQLVIDGDTIRWQPAAVATMPEPTPVTTPPVVPTTPVEWQDQIKFLLARYRTAAVVELPTIREEARKAIEVPAAVRKPVQMNYTTRNVVTARIAREGAEFIERFVAPEFTNNTKIEVVRLRARRSYHQGGVIHLGPIASKSTAAHEIMHGVEQQNPKLLKAASDFLLGRSEGKTAISLRKLTGEPYRSDERAFEDKWRQRNGSVYAGKVYSLFGNPTEASQFRATEILTMGIERLIADPLEFYQHDPEWFEFMVKTLRNL